jgi:hypothetical protein
MRHAFVVAGLVLLGACAHGPALMRRSGVADGEVESGRAAVDSLYWRAVHNLDPANRNRSLEAAITSLDAYLASTGRLEHVAEAVVLRNLARNAQQLGRMEALLQSARASAAERPRSDADSKSRDDDMIKEIQRLKDELAKANDELERIKKRLAAPKP